MLKSKSLIALIALSFSASALAAETSVDYYGPDHKEFGLKVMVGGALSNINVGANLFGQSISKSVGSKTNVEFGVGGDFYVNDFMRAEVNAIYAARGASGTDPSSGTEGSISFRYIQIPALLKFTPIRQVSLNVGPYAAYGIGSIKGKSKTGQEQSMTWAQSTLNRTDYGLILGAGTVIPLSQVDLTVDLRYNLGVANLSSNSIVTVKNRAFTLHAGVRI